MRKRKQIITLSIHTHTHTHTHTHENNFKIILRKTNLDASGKKLATSAACIGLRDSDTLGSALDLTTAAAAAFVVVVADVAPDFAE